MVAPVIHEIDVNVDHWAQPQLDVKPGDIIRYKCRLAAPSTNRVFGYNCYEQYVAEGTRSCPREDMIEKKIDMVFMRSKFPNFVISVMKHAYVDAALYEQPRDMVLLHRPMSSPPFVWVVI